MEHRDFIYWLQGFFEVAKPVTLDAEQVEMIRRHLALCLVNVTARPDFNKLVAQPIAPPFSPFVDPKWVEPSITPPWTVTCATGIVKDDNSRIIAVC